MKVGYIKSILRNSNNQNYDKRNQLIEYYSDQINNCTPFLRFVYSEAIRKLSETDIEVERIEIWVDKLKKSWVEI